MLQSPIVIFANCEYHSRTFSQNDQLKCGLIPLRRGFSGKSKRRGVKFWWRCLVCELRNRNNTAQLEHAASLSVMESFGPNLFAPEGWFTMTQLSQSVFVVKAVNLAWKWNYGPGALTVPPPPPVFSELIELLLFDAHCLGKNRFPDSLRSE